MWRYLTWVLVLFSLQGFSFQLKKALSQIEKAEYQAAQESVLKVLKKDSLDPGAAYVYSVLYLSPAFNNFSIDSAHASIRKSKAYWAELDQKKQQKLTRIGINQATIKLQKSRVDSAAFRRADELGTEQAYNDFLNSFKDADEIDLAILKRNKAAFSVVQEAGNAESYYQFLQKYPDAEQVTLAKQRYDDLLFREKLTDGSLNSYKQFLNDYPETPHRAIIEENIFKLSVADNSLKSLEVFVDDYPNSSFARQAFDMIYHRFKEKADISSFLNQYPAFPDADSIKLVMELESHKRFPFLKEKRLHYLIIPGLKVMATDESSIPPEYGCQLLEEDYVVTSGSGEAMIAGLNGVSIYKGPIENHQDLGFGFLKVRQSGKFGIVHKSGLQLIDFKYDDFRLLDGRLFAAAQGDSWGIITLFDQEVLGFSFDSVEALTGHVALEKNGRFALVELDRLVKAINDKEPELEFIYDEIELLGNNLLCYQGDKEALLSPELKPLISLGNHEIIELNDFWIVKGNPSYSLYSKIGRNLTENADDIYFTDHLVAFKKESKWYLVDSQNLGINPPEFDTLRLISDNFYVTGRNDTMWLHTLGESLDLTNSISLQLLRPANRELWGPETEHVLSLDKDGVKRLYNSQGKKVLAGWFDQTYVLDDHLFAIEEKGKFGISDSTGRNVLPIKYEAIGSYQKGLVSILQRGKFGAFHYPTKKLIEPRFSSQPTLINDSLIIAKRGSLFGIINLDQAEVYPFQFQTIQVWSEKLILAKKTNGYLLIDLSSPNDSINFSFINFDSKNPDIAFVKTPEGSGVYHRIHGEVIPPVFNEVININSVEEPIFLASKYFEPADIRIIALYDNSGALLWRDALTNKDYQGMHCNR